MAKNLVCLKYAVRRVISRPVGPRSLHQHCGAETYRIYVWKMQWVPPLSHASTACYTEQLDYIVVQLMSYRSLRPQGSIITGMFPVPPKHSLYSVSTQHWLDLLWLLSGSEFAENLISHLLCNCAMIFAHADRVSRVIMAQVSIITAILDWAHAGWYLEY
jgi:hypothetical protein